MVMGEPIKLVRSMPFSDIIKYDESREIILNQGEIGVGTDLLSIPFVYQKRFELNTNIVNPNLYYGQVLLKSQSKGYWAGKYSHPYDASNALIYDPNGEEDVWCFFNQDKKDKLNHGCVLKTMKGYKYFKRYKAPFMFTGGLVHFEGLTMNRLDIAPDLSPQIIDTNLNYRIKRNKNDVVTIDILANDTDFGEIILKLDENKTAILKTPVGNLEIKASSKSEILNVKLLQQ